MTTDELYMERCLQLAQLGAGKVSTNPMVGCVIVNNGIIIGEGYHHAYGQAHAEVNAINAVVDKSILPKSTLYVTLEPCAHYGKTPPCADLITTHQLQRVVIGTTDTFSLVAGKGIEKLKNASIEVIVGVLEDECRYQNRRFFCYNEKKRPYVVLKWAQTADGFIGRLPAENNLDKRISNSETDIWVHRLRTEEDAILVGKNTALLDNPSLTARLWHGKNPSRVLIDRRLDVPKTSNIFNANAPVVVFNEQFDADENNVRYYKTDFEQPLIPQVLSGLYKNNIQSVLVEGGAATLQQFIDTGLWDEAFVITAEKNWGHGVKAPLINGSVINTQTIGSDTISLIHPTV